jgi:hypothetical protein
MSKIGISGKFFAFALTLLIPLSGLAFVAFADPAVDDLVSRATLTKLNSGVSEWSKNYAYEGVWSVHLKAPGKATKVEEVNEGRIGLKLAAGTTLEDIASIRWWVRAISGYPPHVDLLLDLDKNGVSDETLVAEFAYQPYVGPGYAYASPGKPYGHYDPGLGGTYYNPTYSAWLETFQKNSGEAGTTFVSDDTVFWLASGQSGPYAGGYFGKLESFKDGDVEVIGGTQHAPVNEDTVVLEIQIEVDNWLGPSEAYVDKALLNDEPVITELRPPKINVIKPESKAYAHINIPVKISAYDIFGIKKVWFNVKNDAGAWFYAANRTYREPAVMQYLPVGAYTFYAWAENELGVVGRNSTIRFTVQVTTLSVDLNPNTLNLRSSGRWVTLRITPPSGQNAEEINIKSVRLRIGDDNVPALWGNVVNGVLMVKVSRASLQKILIGHVDEEVEIKVTGAYDDGTAFEGTDTVRVIDPGKRGNKPWDGTSEGDDDDEVDRFTKNWKFGWKNWNSGKSKNKGWH